MADSKMVENVLAAVVTVRLIILVIMAIYPFQNSLNVVIGIVGGLIGISIVNALIHTFIPFLLNIIYSITAPFAYINSHCKRNLDGEWGGAEQNRRTYQGDTNWSNANQGNANRGNTNQGGANRGNTNQGGANRSNANQSNENRGGANNRRTGTYTKTPLDEAKELFHVQSPFTKEDIRVIRNTLIKKHHPDVGGSEEMCKKINEAYDLLSKYAS